MPPPVEPAGWREPQTLAEWLIWTAKLAVMIFAVVLFVYACALGYF